MSVKTVVKNINELEKEKSKLREQARIQHIKKSEVESDLKRKIHNIIGKINEQRINNNSVMINKTR
jgi:phage-related minor tail protein